MGWILFLKLRLLGLQISLKQDEYLVLQFLKNLCYLAVLFRLDQLLISLQMMDAYLVSGRRGGIVFLPGFRISLNTFHQTKNAPITCNDSGNPKNQQ